MNETTLLSIDWDFFFPYEEAWDWGMTETPMHIAHLWEHRASSFLRNGLELPELSGEQDSFWNRFRFAEDCLLHHAESHAAIVNAVRGIKTILSYDAHHDAGYQGQSYGADSVGCDNWVCDQKARGRKVLVRYPRWKKHAFVVEPSADTRVYRKFDTGRNERRLIHRVFVCRSGAWVPSWHDAAYNRFLESFPGRRIELQPLVPRFFSREDAQNEADVIKNLILAFR